MTDPTPIDPAREFVVTRDLDAPRDLVWRAWTEPGHIERWWGPEHFTARVEAFELREGGTWRIVMIGPDGAEYPGTGTFREIVPGERIVTTDEFGEDFELPGVDELPTGILLTCTFEDRNGGTRVTVRVTHPTPEEKRAHEEMGAVEGWRSMLGCLADHLATVRD